MSGADVLAAALCFVWGHGQPVGTTAWNPYTDRVRMIVVDSGDAQANQWRDVSRNVEQDWAAAFGGPVPRIKGVAIGADTDNTADTVTALSMTCVSPRFYEWRCVMFSGLQRLMGREEQESGATGRLDHQQGRKETS